MTSSIEALLNDAAARAARYLEGLGTRPVRASATRDELVAALGGPLPEDGEDAATILRALDEEGAAGTVASAGGRYFGFVTGSTLPAALGATWLAAAWDQNGFSEVSSPVATAVEQVALDWLLDCLRLPDGTGAAFVTGATMANFTALAAARHALLARAGWDVEARGLFGAPEIAVVVGAEAHATVFKALGLLGLGRERVIRVEADDQGRMLADRLPEPGGGPTLVCVQAGNVNSGAFDPVAAVCDWAHESGAWVHVDGAFGLWGRASASCASLVDGLERADSWATDAHKWLNVPYDSGVAFVRDPAHLRGAMAVNAAYLPDPRARDPFDFTPEASRRARGIEVWAALRALGRRGVEAMVDRHCAQARRFAQGFRDAGFDVLNEVVLNQVMVAFGDDAATERVIERVQADGTCWCGGTVWHGRRAMRVSVSSWATTDDDVEASLEAIVRLAGGGS